MVQQRHGDEQFRAWRRGFNTPPPPVSSFSQHYPGNDPRYQKYLTDVRYSVRESIIRSIEKGKIQLHRKLPKSESLEDCMKRTIPFFTSRIVPEAIDQNKRVLISSSENAIRGLLMHLCDIPEEEITGESLRSYFFILPGAHYRRLPQVLRSRMACQSSSTSSRNVLSCWTTEAALTRWRNTTSGRRPTTYLSLAKTTMVSENIGHSPPHTACEFLLFLVRPNHESFTLQEHQTKNVTFVSWEKASN
jgi:hypothetical protein